MLPGDYVTDDAGTGIVHIAPSHGEEDFALVVAHNRAHPDHRIEVPECVGDDGTYTVQAPGFEGLHVFKAHTAVYDAMRALGTLAATGKLQHSLSAFLAVEEAGDLSRHAAMVHRDGRCERDPRQGARRHRADAFRAGGRAQPARFHDRGAAGLVHLPPARLGRADPGVRVSKQSGEPLRDPAIIERVVDAFRTEGADAWYKPGAAARFLGDDRDPAQYEQVMDIVDVWFESGSHPRLRAAAARAALPGGPVPGRVGPASRLVPFVAAGIGRHAMAWRPSRRC